MAVAGQKLPLFLDVFGTGHGMAPGIPGIKGCPSSQLPVPKSDTICSGGKCQGFMMFHICFMYMFP